MSKDLDVATIKNFALRRNRMNQAKARLETIDDKKEVKRRANILKEQEKEFSEEYGKESKFLDQVKEKFDSLPRQVKDYYMVLYPSRFGPRAKKEEPASKDEDTGEEDEE